jgi:hypothetical protein
VLGEIYYGIFDGQKAAENIKILQSFISVDRINILHINDKTAVIFEKFLQN